MADRMILDAWGRPHAYSEGIPLKQRDSVRGIVRNERGEYLFVRTSYRHLLLFPGGGIDAGESDHETLRRELLEETGRSVEPEPAEIFLNTYSEFYWKGQFFFASNRHYLARITSDVVLPPHDEDGEVEEIIWLRLEDIRPEDCYEFEISVIQQLRVVEEERACT